MQFYEETAAICGLFCGSCSLYPTQCHGCLSEKVADACRHCPNGFRACAKEHQSLRCSDCRKFPCDKLNDFSHQHYKNGIGHHTHVIQDLQYLKTHGIDAWLSYQIRKTICPLCGERILWYDVHSHTCKKKL